MYPDDQMMEAFGKLNPDTTERTAYFFELWMIRKPYEIKFTDNPPLHHDICKSLGLRTPWDYQIQGNAIRFDNAEQFAYYRIAKGNTQ
tara:strand:- start:233 stop:496 length:264 start_codon:yes stop_codon:yes gene_type:complete